MSDKFFKFASLALVLIAVFWFYNQTNSNGAVAGSSTVSVENGVQVVKMNALAYGYEPSQITIKAGLPVRWEITDKGTSGCTNAIISRDLFEGQIDLVRGQTSVKEFTAPSTPGTYRFSCWMGMVQGQFIVIN